MAQGPMNSILVTIRIAVRIQESEVWNPHCTGLSKKLPMDFDEILWRARVWPRDQLITFWWRSANSTHFTAKIHYLQIPLLAISAPPCSLSLTSHNPQSLVLCCLQTLKSRCRQPGLPRRSSKIQTASYKTDVNLLLLLLLLLLLILPSASLSSSASS